MIVALEVAEVLQVQEVWAQSVILEREVVSVHFEAMEVEEAGPMVMD